MKRTIQRSILILVLLLLSVVLFYIGKGHTLLIDTHAITIDNKEYSAADALEVSVDGKEPESMGRAERSLVSVGGPWHTITITIDDANNARQTIVRNITLPTFLDTVVVSIPAMLADTPESSWLQKFIPAAIEDSPAEQMVDQDDDETHEEVPNSK